MIMMPPNPIGWARKATNGLAIQYRLPTIYQGRAVLDDGLVSCGQKQSDRFHRAANYVDRILRGAKQGDPTRYAALYSAARLMVRDRQATTSFVLITSAKFATMVPSVALCSSSVWVAVPSETKMTL
jgi:hypothetical protein